ncbi:MAG: PHP domain-containing protein [Candidatus Woesearchaeota archaeon]
MLKADLHLHAKEDKQDNINYTAKELIDKAAELKYNVLSFTFHRKFFWKKELYDYAKNKGITLIPGAELSIEKRDVLVYNLSKNDDKIKTFEELRKLKKKNKNLFVIAPHPYFKLKYCLEDELEKNIDIFDAIEFCWFYTKTFNMNKKAIKIAKKYKLPLIATSDNHLLWNFGKNYTLIDTKKPNEIFKKIKENKIKIYSPPRTLFTIGIITLLMINKDLIKNIKQIFRK